MGYTTDFTGRLKFNKQLSLDDHTFLTKLSETRRMARNVDEKYGVEGEFYVEDTNDFGQDKNDNIIDYNVSPRTQPGLWLQWTPTEDGWYLEWNGAEKFYNYVEWLEYLIEKVLEPRGYVLNGLIEWQGEDSDDIGQITVVDNVVTTQEGQITYRQTDVEITNHLVFTTIQEALVDRLGMTSEGGGDSSTGGIENVYSKGDYKVTIEMRN